MTKTENISDNNAQILVQTGQQIVSTVIDVPKTKAIKTKITLSITQEDSDKVKIYALKNHTTVSELLHEWIQAKCSN